MDSAFAHYIERSNKSKVSEPCLLSFIGNIRIDEFISLLTLGKPISLVND